MSKLNWENHKTCKSAQQSMAKINLENHNVLLGRNQNFQEHTETEPDLSKFVVGKYDRKQTVAKSDHAKVTKK